MPETKKYRKKPVIVKAYRTDKKMTIHTLEGDMIASVGDYIITGSMENNTHVSPIFLKKPTSCAMNRMWSLDSENEER